MLVFKVTVSYFHDLTLEVTIEVAWSHQLCFEIAHHASSIAVDVCRLCRLGFERVSETGFQLRCESYRSADVHLCSGQAGCVASDYRCCKKTKTTCHLLIKVLTSPPVTPVWRICNGMVFRHQASFIRRPAGIHSHLRWHDQDEQRT